MRNAIRFFEDTDVDEFYWNVNGLDWPQSFVRVTANVHVAADLASRLTGAQACYAGPRESTAGCPIAAATAADGSVTVRAEARDLGPHEPLPFAVAFTSGTFTPFDPSYFASPWGWLQALSGLVLPAALVWAIILRVRRLAAAPGQSTIIPG